jgi:SAM-dependent methyltransferase
MALSYNSRYDSDPSGYDRLRSCWLNERRADYLSKQLTSYRLAAGSLVVEIGSGTGWLLNHLGESFPYVRFLGLDPIPAYVEFARKRAPANVEYVMSTVEEAGRYITESPQLVLSNDVLHHLNSYEAAARTFALLGASGCRWLVIEPNSTNPYTWFRQWIGPGERNFHPGPFRQAAAENGWTVLHKGYMFLIPPFVKRPCAWMRALEQRFEHVPMLAGGVSMELQLDEVPSPKSTAPGPPKV